MMAPSPAAAPKKGDDDTNNDSLRGNSASRDDDTHRDTETDDSEVEEKQLAGKSVSARAISHVDQQQHLKREKRLAMNRASARERRRRKRILLENLEERVLELTKQVQTLQEVNEGFQTHIRKLESELTNAHGVIAMLSASPRSALIDAPASSLATAGLAIEDPAARALNLRSLLLAAGGGGAATNPTASPLTPEFRAGANAGLNGHLADRQLGGLLDLQRGREKSLLAEAGALVGTGTLGGKSNASALASASIDLAGSAAAALAATPSPAGSAGGSSSILNPLLGRLGYLNAVSDKSGLSRLGSGFGGETKLDVGDATATVQFPILSQLGAGVAGLPRLPGLLGTAGTAASGILGSQALRNQLLQKGSASPPPTTKSSEVKRPGCSSDPEDEGAHHPPKKRSRSDLE